METYYNELLCKLIVYAIHPPFSRTPHATYILNGLFIHPDFRIVKNNLEASCDPITMRDGEYTPLRLKRIQLHGL